MSNELALFLLILLSIWSLVTFGLLMQSGDVMTFLRSTGFAISVIGYIIILMVYPIGKKLFGGGNEYN